MQDLWTSVIAGAYSALCLTMWGTALVYTYKVWKNYSKLGLSTAILMLGIAITFSGHAVDQTLWTMSNVDRAIQGGAHLKLSAWYAQHIPEVIVAGKFFASMGAFFHLWVAFHPERGVAGVVAGYSLAWFIVAATITFITY